MKERVEYGVPDKSIDKVSLRRAHHKIWPNSSDRTSTLLLARDSSYSSGFIHFFQILLTKTLSDANDMFFIILILHTEELMIHPVATGHLSTRLADALCMDHGVSR
jgi:hypothetical protein